MEEDEGGEVINGLRIDLVCRDTGVSQTRHKRAYGILQYTGGGMGLSGREQQNRNQYTYVDEGSGGQC